MALHIAKVWWVYQAADLPKHLSLWFLGWTDPEKLNIFGGSSTKWSLNKLEKSETDGVQTWNIPEDNLSEIDRNFSEFQMPYLKCGV